MFVVFDFKRFQRSTVFRRCMLLDDSNARKRLKGCEAEVANMLDDHWKPIVLEWEFAMDDEDIPLDERRI